MIYLGDNWPKSYRNTLFTNNLHGRRINNDILVRKGSGYIGQHGKDFLLSKDKWFRGISILYGPDGGVFVSDWSDIGECHDTNKVHRTSGRIFKVTYGKPANPGKFNLAKLSDAELVKLQLHQNDFYVRHARRLLQERAFAGKDMTKVHAALGDIFENNPDVTRKLRSMWALYVTGGLNDPALIKMLDHQSEHIRVWAIQLIVDDKKIPVEAVNKFAKLAKDDPSQLVRLWLASALQRMPLDRRWNIVEGLVGHAEDKDDPNLPLMIWYGIEPLVGSDSKRALQLIPITKISLLRQYIARRAAGTRKK